MREIDMFLLGTLGGEGSAAPALLLMGPQSSLVDKEVA